MSDTPILAAVDIPRAGESLYPGWTVASGWALDPAAPIQSVFLRVNGADVACAQTRMPSLELARGFSSTPHAANSGWIASFDLRRFAGQSARIEVVCVTAAGDAFAVAAVTCAVRSEAEGARRECGAFTIVQNEARYLPIWLNYYGRQFGPENLFVLDHGSTDGSTSGLAGRCNVIPVHRPLSFDHMWLKATVEHFQAFLLNSYDTVVFAEVDEFIVAEPARYPGLRDYIRAMGNPVARCTGYNVVHYPEEAALNFAEPIMAQRRYAHMAPQYDKTLIAKVPLHWILGFHRVIEFGCVEPDPDLALFHFHRVDYDYCRARHEEAAKRRWCDLDKQRGLGRQSQIFEPEAFHTWFYTDTDIGHPTRAEIPPQYRTAF